MTILAEGVMLVAKATAIRVSTKKVVRADRKVEDWARRVLEGCGESRLLPFKFRFKEVESATRSFQLNQINKFIV